jgi:hypothetical protein
MIGIASQLRERGAAAVAPAQGKPNPALHLTPPCDLDGIASLEGAVQVSFIVQRRIGTR